MLKKISIILVCALLIAFIFIGSDVGEGVFSDGRHHVESLPEQVDIISNVPDVQEAKDNTAGASDSEECEAEDEIKAYNLIAKDQEQFHQLLLLLKRLGIEPDNVLEGIRAIAVTLDKPSLKKLLSEAGPTFYEDDTSVEHPPIVYSSSTPFNEKWLSWLGIDSEDANRGKGVKIAIIDEPIVKTEATAAANIQQIDLFGLAGKTEGEHGNAIASILAADSELVKGTSTAAQILSIPIIDSSETGSAFNLAAAIITAVDSGAQIISISLCSDAYSQTLNNAVQYAAEKGAVIVAAAGNDGENKSVYPASYEHVISVAACDANGNAAFFSNTSDNVDICAPGIGLLVNTAAHPLEAFTGTSAATPCVAGVIANVLAANPGMTAVNAAEIVQEYALDNGAVGKDSSFGAGLLNYERAANWNNDDYTDIAAAGHYFNLAGASDTSVPLEISAQNTGNTTIGVMTLEYNVNGKKDSRTFKDVAPGAVVTAKVDVLLVDMSKVNVISNVTTDTQEHTLDNNQKAMSYMLQE